MFKMMLELVMDIEGSTLRSLTQSLQFFRLTDIPSKNIGTVVSYIKGALMLLQKYDAVPTYTMVLLNKTM